MRNGGCACIFRRVAWDEHEAMDAWMYDVVSAVTAPNDSSLSLSLSRSVSFPRSSCAISWLCLRDVHVAQRRNLAPSKKPLRSFLERAVTIAGLRL